VASQARTSRSSASICRPCPLHTSCSRTSSVPKVLNSDFFVFLLQEIHNDIVMLWQCARAIHSLVYPFLHTSRPVSVSQRRWKMKLLWKNDAKQYFCAPKGVPGMTSAEDWGLCLWCRQRTWLDMAADWGHDSDWGHDWGLCLWCRQRTGWTKLSPCFWALYRSRS